MDTSKECDFCNRIVTKWVDGKTRMGPWANMCMQCYKVYGIGLGLGKGQRYVDGKKVEG